MKRRGKICIIGLGPGSLELLAPKARKAIESAQVVIGYQGYVDLVHELLRHQEVIARPLTEEVARAREAVELARAGKQVAVISSGDAGVYGMAGLVYEVLADEGWRCEEGPEVEVVPGISAANACASLVGAPLMHDFAAISLSDLLTPWEIILKRVKAAAEADFVLVLYNPRSRRRTTQIEVVREILLTHRRHTTPVALVKNAYRPGQQAVITTLGEMLNHEMDMLTTVLVGNSRTYVYQGRMITPRGYRDKYSLTREEMGR